VFRTLSAAAGRNAKQLPGGETGIRATWIRFLQNVLASDLAIELAPDVPPFRFVQWDGKLVRQIPRRRLKPGATLDPTAIDSAITSATSARLMSIWFS
jgi:hypothetical protein